jgi:hypothetical protein
MFALGIDAADQIGQRDVTGRGDILQATPERVLETDTRLVARDDDGTLNDR